MNETNLSWSDLKLFLAVARGGGLSAGAKLSGLSAPSLGRHMVDLERALGEVLFRRLPRGYALTQAGQELFEEAEALEGQVRKIEFRRIRRGAQLPIVVSAGTWMTLFLTDHIKSIRADDTLLQFQATETRHNIGRREATIGLRNIRPDDDAAVIRKTTRVAFAPYAAETAVEEKGWIASTAETPSAVWLREHRRERITIEVSHPRSLLDFVCRGVGHTVLPCFIGDRQEGLRRTGPIIPELTHDQWLVVHGEDRTLPQVRKTVDKLVKLIRAQKQLFEGTSAQSA